MPPQTRVFERTITKTLRLPYLMFTPHNMEADPDRRWPLVLFLHGSGERGNDPSQVLKYGLPKIVADQPDIPFIMLAPQCPAHTTWATQLDALDALLGEAVNTLPVDEDRVLVTGMSMGGGGAWLLASAFPDRFAALAPVCASKWYAGNVDEQVSRLAHLPVWAFHGEADDIVPFAETVKLVDALTRQGGNVRFTRYPGVGHNSWDRAYAEPDLYPWLLQQRASHGAQEK